MGERTNKLSKLDKLVTFEEALSWYQRRPAPPPKLSPKPEEGRRRRLGPDGMSVDQRYRRKAKAEARAKGLCLRCFLRRRLKGKWKCGPCTRYVAENLADRRRRHAAVGLCECGRKVAPGLRKCRKCRERNRRGSEGWYARSKAKGRCACGRPALPKRVRCARCRDNAARYHEGKAEERKRAGLCRCGRRSVPGVTRCQPCRDGDEERARARSRTKTSA